MPRSLVNPTGQDAKPFSFSPLLRRDLPPTLFFTPHVTLSTQVSHSFSFPSLPYPSLSPEIFLPSFFSTLLVTSRIHQCISQIPSLNAKGWGKGVSHIKVTRCSSSRLWCKLIGFSGRKTNIFFAFKCIAYGFAQRNIRIKYQTPDTVSWSVSNKARATSW